ncbi:MAG: SPFH domain-containing protein, partial [Candidatus Brocadiales bacterium]
MVFTKPIKFGLIVGLLIIGGLFVIYAGFKLCVTKVGIDQTGVRTKVWGVGKGVIEHDYSTGWHRRIIKADEWDLYDTTVQTLEMTKEATKEGRERQDILIRTADDYEVSVDLIVKYQLKKGFVYKLRQEIGLGDRYKIFVKTEAKDVCRSVFGKMMATNLYNPDEKRMRAQEAKLLLNKKLESRYVKVIDVLILEITFDPQLERKIKNQKLAELDVVLNISKSLAAEKRGITQEIDANTEAVANRIEGEREGELLILKTLTEDMIEETIAMANKFLVVTHAEADLYKQRKLAAGRLLVKKAEAEGERLRREAMTGFGGSMIVALEAARSINLTDISISTQDIDLLDFDVMIDKFGAPKLISEQEQVPESKPIFEAAPEQEHKPEHGHKPEQEHKPKHDFEYRHGAGA